MQIKECNILEQKELGRWIVVDGGINPFAVDETIRVISLQTLTTVTEYRRGKPKTKKVRDVAVLSGAWEKFVAWTNVPPRKHGKFYIVGSLLEGQSIALDDRFVKVV